MEIENRLKTFIDDKAEDMNPIPQDCLNKASTIVAQLNDFIDIKLELSKEVIEEHLDKLIGYYSITLDLPITVGCKILRARKFEEGKDNEPCFEQVGELLNPPVEDAPLGRCNKQNESVFYGCIYFDEKKGGVDVAFSEVNALKGERVNLLRSQTIKNINLRYIGIWNHIFRDAKPYFLDDSTWEYYKLVDRYMQAKFEEDVFTSMQICDAFFADMLRRKSTARLYKVTSVLASIYLEGKYADGIFYTSVKSEGSPVVALKSIDLVDKIKFMSAESYEIQESYGYSKYSANKLYNGSIETEGKISWSKSR